jgi:type II secretory pathway pseudopilin PulG
MRSETSSRNERGSTLVESLVAIGLFGLVMAAVGNLLITHMRMEGLNIVQTTAIGLAERELEDLRALQYSDIASRTATQTIGGIQYTIRTTVTADSPAPNEKSINTAVTWTDRSGSQSYALNAIYTAITR